VRLAAALAAALVVLPAAAGELTSEAGYALVRQMLSSDPAARQAAAAALIEAGDPGLVPALVDAVFFIPKARRDAILAVLASLTGETLRGYYEWVEYVGAHPALRPKPGYSNFKVAALAQIDPRYREVFYSGALARIRLSEIISGGVPLAGIPALDRPPTIAAGTAAYLEDGERVFGVEVGGDARAYPVRVLSWHELANDVVGGEPITLSYCTLCGSGIVYSGRLEDGSELTFDTSGLLYRSNKLMVDRQTLSLWSNLTGEPVVGRMARGDIHLRALPSTVTTWGAWRRRHPATSVLDLAGVRQHVDPRFHYDYVPGAADRARHGVAFPVWQKSDRLERDAEVYALRIGTAAKAYPLRRLGEQRVVNDTLGGTPLVLLADPEGPAVRAYRRDELEFHAVGEALGDAAGGLWRVEEGRLVALSGDHRGRELERLVGHLAFWFGWYGFYPQTEVWE
jgi:Protein of unknown function (DUF3179)